MVFSPSKKTLPPLPSSRLTAVNIRRCQLPRGTKVNSDELALWAEEQPQSGARPELLYLPKAPTTRVPRC